jgi:hypothetical protein
VRDGAAAQHVDDLDFLDPVLLAFDFSVLCEKQRAAIRAPARRQALRGFLRLRPAMQTAVNLAGEAAPRARHRRRAPTGRCRCGRQPQPVMMLMMHEPAIVSF